MANQEVRKFLSKIGRKGGSVSSPRKRRASRLNGRKHKAQATPTQKGNK